MLRRVKSAYTDYTQSKRMLIPYLLNAELETPWECACALLKGLDHGMKFIWKPLKWNMYYLYVYILTILHWI